MSVSVKGTTKVTAPGRKPHPIYRWKCPQCWRTYQMFRSACSTPLCTYIVPFRRYVLETGPVHVRLMVIGGGSLLVGQVAALLHVLLKLIYGGHG